MRRNNLNFIIDLASFVLLLGMIVTGVIIKWVLPPGSGGRHGGHGEHVRELLGMGRHDWGDVHFYLAVGFVILMAVHVYMHWGWIKCQFLRRKRDSIG